MKNLFRKFYKSLACRIALSIVATATTANAHDLPANLSFAPTDWGMIQQDCLGFQNSAIELDSITETPLTSYVIAQPDAGNPPAPEIPISNNCNRSNELVATVIYDGIDCAQLESFYRGNTAIAPAEDEQASAPQIAATEPEVGAGIEFNKSFYGACTCEFERQQANQSILPPRFILKRTYIEDYFANLPNALKPLVLRDFNRPSLTGDSLDALATAIPTAGVQNKHLLADALSELASFDCVARSEFYSSYRAFQLGEFASSLAVAWFAESLPSTSKAIADFANHLKPASIETVPAPMFVIYKTIAGNELAIPIEQARDWQQPLATPEVATSQKLQELIDSTSSRLRWAGGRLSEAASYMNEWFNERVARAKTSELR